ncbi:MAG: MarR family transcriptional regulator [Ilumatobacter sp.]
MPSCPSEPASDAVAELTRRLLRVSFVIISRRSLPNGLSPTDTRALEALDLLARGPASPSELSNQLGVSRPAATAIVDRLEAVGFVARHVVASDRRRINVALTDAARTFGTENLRPLARSIERAVSELSPDDARSVANYITAVIAGIESSGAPE